MMRQTRPGRKVHPAPEGKTKPALPVNPTNATGNAGLFYPVTERDASIKKKNVQRPTSNIERKKGATVEAANLIQSHSNRLFYKGGEAERKANNEPQNIEHRISK
ncbi:MAG: hypothetical protein V1789_07115 [PVC group bacterium]